MYEEMLIESANEDDEQNRNQYGLTVHSVTVVNRVSEPACRDVTHLWTRSLHR
jgi:hypothetical protein